VYHSSGTQACNHSGALVASILSAWRSVSPIHSSRLSTWMAAKIWVASCTSTGGQDEMSGDDPRWIYGFPGALARPGYPTSRDSNRDQGHWFLLGGAGSQLTCSRLRGRGRQPVAHPQLRPLSGSWLDPGQWMDNDAHMRSEPIPLTACPARRFAIAESP